MKQWKIIARNNDWVAGCTITQSYNIHGDGSFRRFTATIRGWRGFLIYEGKVNIDTFSIQKVQEKVREIRDRIDSGDEKVFTRIPKLLIK